MALMRKKTFVSIFKEEMKSQTWHKFKLGLFYCMLKKGIDQLPVRSLGVSGSLEKNLQCSLMIINNLEYKPTQEKKNL